MRWNGCFSLMIFSMRFWMPSVSVALSVRGVAATCTTGNCGYLYASALTPILSSAVATSTNDALWTLSLAGSGFATPATDNRVSVGTAPCTPTGGP